MSAFKKFKGGFDSFMAKKQSKVKTWKDIANLKKVKEIKLDNKVIFTIEELSAGDLDAFIQEIYNTNELDQEGQEVELSNERIGALLRKMVKGIDFEDLSNEEIVEILNTFGEDVVQQINSAVSEFVIQKIYKRLENLGSLVEDMKKLDKSVEKVEKFKGGVVQ